LVVIYYEK